jgi:4-hydroxy-4-methyl-2-oxoglutarate aldolase
MNTCDVSDACDELGIRAVRTGSLRPLWDSCPAVSGPVSTVRLEPTGEHGATPLPELLALLPQARGGVVLVDLEGRTDCQCWGSVLATAARYHGVGGALVNGAVRDLEGLRELRFPTYARGTHPAAIRGRLRVAAVNEPVALDGGFVEPGSVAVADGSGVVFAPAERRDEIAQLAERRSAQELERRQAIAAGADPGQLFLP